MSTNFAMDKAELNSIHSDIDNSMVQLDFELSYKFPIHNWPNGKDLLKIFFIYPSFAIQLPSP